MLPKGERADALPEIKHLQNTSLGHEGKKAGTRYSPDCQEKVPCICGQEGSSHMDHSACLLPTNRHTVNSSNSELLNLIGPVQTDAINSDTK